MLTTSKAFRATIPALNGLGSIGKIFFSYGFLAYVAIAFAILIRWFLNRTMVGLNLRAVGEDPAAADAVGIDVTKYKYLSTICKIDSHHSSFLREIEFLDTYCNIFILAHYLCLI